MPLARLTLQRWLATSPRKTKTTKGYHSEQCYDDSLGNPACHSPK